VVTFGFKTVFGGGRSTGFGLIYDDEAAQKKFEPKYRLVRVRTPSTSSPSPNAHTYNERSPVSQPKSKRHPANCERSARTGQRRYVHPTTHSHPTRANLTHPSSSAAPKRSRPPSPQRRASKPPRFFFRGRSGAWFRCTCIPCAVALTLMRFITVYIPVYAHFAEENLAKRPRLCVKMRAIGGRGGGIRGSGYNDERQVEDRNIMPKESTWSEARFLVDDIGVFLVFFCADPHLPGRHELRQGSDGGSAHLFKCIQAGEDRSSYPSRVLALGRRIDLDFDIL
jgi:hypothetical protein